ncbi:MAG: hypothetical protein ABI874_02720 [Chloroflexota bacterium]
MGALGLSAIALAGPWYAFVALNGVSNTDFLPLTITTLVANANRVPSIAWHMLLNLASPSWNFVWPLAVLVVVWRPVRFLKPNGSMLLPLTALIYLCAISATFIFSSHVPYQQHVVSSVDRLAAHVAPLAVLWLAREVSR